MLLSDGPTDAGGPGTSKEQKGWPTCQPLARKVVTGRWAGPGRLVAAPSPSRGRRREGWTVEPKVRSRGRRTNRVQRRGPPRRVPSRIGEGQSRSLPGLGIRGAGCEACCAAEGVGGRVQGPEAIGGARLVNGVAGTGPAVGWVSFGGCLAREGQAYDDHETGHVDDVPTKCGQRPNPGLSQHGP